MAVGAALGGVEWAQCDGDCRFVGVISEVTVTVELAVQQEKFTYFHRMW